MQFVAHDNFHTLEVRKVRFLHPRQVTFLLAGLLLNIKQFVKAIQERNNEFKIDVFLRSLLYQLPLYLGDHIHDDVRVSVLVAEPELCAWFSLQTGYAPASTSGRVNTHVPGTKTSRRRIIQRSFASNFSEKFKRFPECLFVSLEHFQRLLSIWTKDAEERLFSGCREISVGSHTLVELANLGELLRVMVAGEQFHNSRLLSRLAVHCYKIYGEDGFISFWRIANLDYLDCFLTPEEILFSSSVYTEMFI
uniref:P0 protein n=1 Tax=Brassica yellows virus TaxID=1046403 RepID=A0A3G9HNV7_9VIRU|nr:P0 protein [Brassica yellows virus]